MTFHTEQKGAALIYIMVFVMVIGVIFYFLMDRQTLLNRNSLAAKSSSELEILKQTITQRLDCHQSLGVSNGSGLPLNCSNYNNVTLRKKDGTTFNSGLWNLTAKCQGNKIIVGYSRSGNNPLTGNLWNISLLSSDLFEGTRGFCQQFFTMNSPCTNPYNYLATYREGEPLCCRMVTAAHDSGAPAAVCNVDEFLYVSGQHCSHDNIENGGGGYLHMQSVGSWYNGFLGSDEFFGDRNAISDCNGFGTVVPFRGAMQWSESNGVCCPSSNYQLD